MRTVQLKVIGDRDTENAGFGQGLFAHANLHVSSCGATQFPDTPNRVSGYWVQGVPLDGDRDSARLIRFCGLLE